MSVVGLSAKKQAPQLKSSSSSSLKFFFFFCWALFVCLFVFQLLIFKSSHLSETLRINVTDPDSILIISTWVVFFFPFFFWVLIFASSNILKEEEGIQSEEEDWMQFKSLTQNRQIGVFFSSSSSRWSETPSRALLWWWIDGFVSRGFRERGWGGGGVWSNKWVVESGYLWWSVVVVVVVVVV